MIMGYRGICHSTTRRQTPALAGRADDLRDIHSHPHSSGCEPSCLAEALLGYAAGAVRKTPDRLWQEQQRRNADVKGISNVLDSRIEFWCDRLGYDPKLYRAALEAGYTVSFSGERRGRHVVFHRVLPRELE